MAELYELLSGRTASAPTTYAWDLYENPNHRVVVDAFMLATTDFDVISKALGIPVDVLSAYAYLFLDTKALRNRLELLSFVAAYDGDAPAKELVKTAVTVGLEYLLWLHGVAPELDPRTVVRRTMVDSFYRGMAHRGNALTTATAKEAQKWWATAIRNAQLLEQIDPRATRAAYDELRIALEGKDDTLSPEKAPVPVDQMLH